MDLLKWDIHRGHHGLHESKLKIPQRYVFGDQINAFACNKRIRDGVSHNKSPKWIVVLNKITILQKVGHPITCLGVCYVNNPKKGKYTTHAPALDPTTSLQSDFLSLNSFCVQQLPCCTRCTMTLSKTTKY